MVGGGWRGERCHLVPPGPHPVLALLAPPPHSHPSLGEQVSLGTSSQSTSSPYSPLARALCSNALRRFHHPPPAATATPGLRTEAHSLTLLRLRVTRLREGLQRWAPRLSASCPLSFPGCQLPSSEEMAEAGAQGDRCFTLERGREKVGMDFPGAEPLGAFVHSTSPSLGGGGRKRSL